MKVFLVGATGRVGTEFLRLALTADHEVTALVRDPAKLTVSDPRLKAVTGDLRDAAALDAAYCLGTWDVVVNLAGADPLKASTVVTDSARALVPLAEAARTPRYLGITGTAQMPKTFLGRISIAVLRRTPVRHAASDHDGALSVIKASTLDWTLVGCPWIKDGPTRGTFQQSTVFPGGMRRIHPGDVALALLEQLGHPASRGSIVGVWY